MRILPRSCRGTWLLAGVVWLGACVWLWWALPFRPRVMICPEHAVRCFDFGPDGATVLTIRPAAWQIDNSSWGWPATIETWSCSTGEQAGKSLEVWFTLGSQCWSPDRRWLFLGPWGTGDRRIRIYNVVSGRIEILPGVSTGDRWIERFEFSPDSRQLVIDAASEGKPGLVIWDLAERRLHGLLEDVQFPIAMSPDGRTIAAENSDSTGNRVIVTLFDRASLRPVKSLAAGVAIRIDRMRITPDNKALLARVDAVMDDVGFLGEALSPIAGSFVCWDIDSGRQRFAMSDVVGECAFTADGQILMVVRAEPPLYQLQWRDLESGSPDREIAFRTDAAWFGQNFLTPDCQLLALGTYTLSENLWQRLLAALNLGSAAAPVDAAGSVQIIKAENGEQICEFSALSTLAKFSPDGLTFAAFTDPKGMTSAIGVWDIPPHKPLTWFAAGAALLALAIGWLAWRRVRKFRAVAAL